MTVAAAPARGPDHWHALAGCLLDFEAYPGRYPQALREPRLLFDHGTEILMLASGRALDGLPQDAALQARMREAARFFVRTAMLRTGVDHYTLMGVAPGFDAATLREHYRMLIRLTHPDFAADGGEWPVGAATRINQANDVLSSPERRLDYERTQPRARQWAPSVRAPVLPRPQRRAGPEPVARWGLPVALRHRGVLAGGAVAGVLVLVLGVWLGSGTSDGDHSVALADRRGALEPTAPLQVAAPAPATVALATATGATPASGVVPMPKSVPAPAPAVTATDSTRSRTQRVVVALPPSTPARPPRPIPVPAAVVAPAPALGLAAAGRAAAPRRLAAPPLELHASTQLTRPAAAGVRPAAVLAVPAPVVAAAAPPVDPASAQAVAAAHAAGASLSASPVAPAPVALRAPEPAPPANVVAARPQQAPQPPPANGAAPRISMADVQPLLGQVLGALQSGRGEQVLPWVERPSQPGDGANSFVQTYNRVVANSRNVRLGPVQFSGRTLGERLLVDGVVLLHVDDANQRPATHELVLRAQFASRGGQPVMIQLGASEIVR